MLGKPSLQIQASCVSQHTNTDKEHGLPVLAGPTGTSPEMCFTLLLLLAALLGLQSGTGRLMLLAYCHGHFCPYLCSPKWVRLQALVGCAQGD